MLDILSILGFIIGFIGFLYICINFKQLSGSANYNMKRITELINKIEVNENKFKNEKTDLINKIHQNKEEFNKTEHALILEINKLKQTVNDLNDPSYLEKQKTLASHDILTGLLNHRRFQENLCIEIERSKRYNSPLALMMCDLDNFKKINDAYGHQTGDKILKMVSHTIKKIIRITDQACRYGGEEFCILLPETSKEDALHIAERLRQMVEMNREVKGIAVTISIGVTGFNQKDRVESLIERVDAYLFQSKKVGKNKITFF